MEDEKSAYRQSGFKLLITSHALNHAYDSLLPILYPNMIAEFHLTYGLVGMLGMGYRLSGGALQLVMGFLGRFFRRKFLLGFGMILQSIANSFGAVSQGFEHVLASRFVAGIGASPQHPTGAAYITDTFPPSQTGKALGINIAAAQIGTFVIPLIGSVVMSALGWRTTILVFSIPGMLVGVAFLMVAESKRPLKRPDKSGFGVLTQGIKEVLSDKTVLAVMAVEMVMAFRIGARDFIPSYLSRELGMAPLEAGLLFAVFLGSGIPAPYFWGYLSDRSERRKIVMVAMGIACVLWFFLPYGSDSLQLILVLLPLGFVGQGVGGVVQAYLAETAAPETRDLTYGVYFTLAFTIGSLSPVILGYLADYLSFQVAFSYVGLVSLLAVIAAYFLK